jgi:hypothetical protein
MQGAAVAVYYNGKAVFALKTANQGSFAVTFADCCSVGRMLSQTRVGLTVGDGLNWIADSLEACIFEYDICIAMHTYIG